MEHLFLKTGCKLIFLPLMDLDTAISNKVNYFSAMLRLLHHVWSLLEQTISVLYKTALTHLTFIQIFVVGAE
jgi:hypothetical protein